MGIRRELVEKERGDRNRERKVVDRKSEGGKEEVEDSGSLCKRQYGAGAERIKKLDR